MEFEMRDGAEVWNVLTEEVEHHTLGRDSLDGVWGAVWVWQGNIVQCSSRVVCALVGAHTP